VPNIFAGDNLKVAQEMAGHESGRKTGLCDRRNDAIAIDKVEAGAAVLSAQGHCAVR
jgi:hypothetical protein